MPYSFDETKADDRYAPIIRQGVEEAIGPGGVPSRPLSPATVRATIERTAHRARVAALAEAAFDLYSAAQVAERLRITPARVRALAEARELGAKLGQGPMAVWVFRMADIDAMRERKPGRPTKHGQRGLV